MRSDLRRAAAARAGGASSGRGPPDSESSETVESWDPSWYALAPAPARASSSSSETSGSVRGGESESWLGEASVPDAPDASTSAGRGTRIVATGEGGLPKRYPLTRRRERARTSWSSGSSPKSGTTPTGRFRGGLLISKSASIAAASSARWSGSISVAPAMNGGLWKSVNRT